MDVAAGAVHAHVRDHTEKWLGMSEEPLASLLREAQRRNGWASNCRPQGERRDHLEGCTGKQGSGLRVH